MKSRFTDIAKYNSDITTYVLIGFILVIVLIGALKIIFI